MAINSKIYPQYLQSSQHNPQIPGISQKSTRYPKTGGLQAMPTPSPARVRANRANAQRSTGPRTPEGKARVAQNALTHGLTAKSLVLDEESQEAFHSLRRRMLEDLNPQGETECQLVEHMIVSRWRLTRSWEIETGLFNQSLAATPSPDPLILRRAQAYAELSPTLDRLNRYEARLQRDYDRSLRRLLELQKLRTAARPKPAAPPEPLRHDQLLTTDEYIRLQRQEIHVVPNKPNPPEPPPENPVS